MTSRTAGWFAWGMAGLFVTLAAFGLWATVVAQGWDKAVDDFLSVPVFISFALTGAVVASRCVLETLQNAAKYSEASRGHLEVRSAPGQGTTVSGRVPASLRDAR